MIRPSLCIAALILALPASAALEPSAIKAQQDKASELVHLEVTKVVKKAVKKNGDHSFEFTVHAKVTKVVRTKSGLKEGSTVEIHYARPNLRKTPSTGDWPKELKKGNYVAYLAAIDAKQNLYQPVAHSGSFEALPVKAK